MRALVACWVIALYGPLGAGGAGVHLLAPCHHGEGGRTEGGTVLLADVGRAGPCVVCRFLEATLAILPPGMVVAVALLAAPAVSRREPLRGASSPASRIARAPPLGCVAAA